MDVTRFIVGIITRFFLGTILDINDTRTPVPQYFVIRNWQ
jgi:hypothetical protein